MSTPHARTRTTQSEGRRPATKKGPPPTRVLSRARVGPEVVIKVESGERHVLRPFVPLGAGDFISSDGGGLVACRADGTPLATITPSFVSKRPIQIDGRQQVLTIKEVETQEEIVGLGRLSEYHYRGAGGSGRVLPLIAKIDWWELPPVVGFIELTSAFLVNPPRTRIFDRGFSDAETGVAWKRWDTRAAKRFTNTVARISRCVVYPEVRGLGLSSLLVEASVEFARTRWHLGGMKPHFIEITADMLRYLPFVASAGFTYIGDTEGNEHRVGRDMRYLLQRSAHHGQGYPKGGGGILDLQRSYATMLAKVMKERKLSLEKLLGYLKRSPETLTDEEWVLLHKVYRRPKPTYMVGLSDAAQRHLAHFNPDSMTQSAKKRTSQGQPLPRETEVASIAKLALVTSTRPASSSRSRKVQEAFGIVTKAFESTLIRHLTFSLNAGESLLVTGPSGTGKSMLLRAIAQLLGDGKTEHLPPSVTVSGEVLSPTGNVALVRPLPNDLPPVDLFPDIGLEEALGHLSSAGLSEAQLFVRPSSYLSDGQAYRLSIALALAQSPRLLLADAFCEPLDRFSAAAVCKRLKNLAKRKRFGLIAATAHADRVIPLLRPDRVLVLTSTGDCRWCAPSELLGGDSEDA